MPDISMCKNSTCKSKETCYRYMAKSSEWQSYCEFGKENNKKCEYYIKAKD